jgi:sulfatase maturation enzyme AslB (radical SAM superfamily)
MTALTGCKSLSIYLGNVCNFNCTYCDRDYIKHSVGGQHMTLGDVPEILAFFKAAGVVDTPPNMITFHGGEPFSYVKIMDKMMDTIVQAVPGDYPFYIQTNGSLMLQNRWFFEKWGSRLEISISYDFMFQELNRSLFEIHPTMQMLTECGVRGRQFQYVMPIDNPKVFSLNAIKSITDVCFKNGVRRINLIPLRHIRGKDKFNVILDDIDMPQFFDAFIKFIHILYTMGLDVIVDGHGDGFDKHYFDDHKQLILSPDGFLYPEYDFLEYKRTETAVGHWRVPITVDRVKTREQEDAMLRPKCQVCPARDLCGLKYLHGMFETDPKTDKCVQFYQMLMVVIQHAQKIKQKKSFFHWVET